MEGNNRLHNILVYRSSSCFAVTFYGGYCPHPPKPVKFKNIKRNIIVYIYTSHGWLVGQVPKYCMNVIYTSICVFFQKQMLITPTATFEPLLASLDKCSRHLETSTCPYRTYVYIYIYTILVLVPSMFGGLAHIRHPCEL